MALANDTLKNYSLQVFTTNASSQNALHLLVLKSNQISTSSLRNLLQFITDYNFLGNFYPPDLFVTEGLTIPLSAIYGLQNQYLVC